MRTETRSKPKYHAEMPPDLGTADGLDPENPRKLLLSLRQTAMDQGGIQALSRKTGLHRVNLNRMLSGKGNPEFRSLVSIVRALGMELRVVRESKNGEEARPAPWATAHHGFPSPGIS